MNVLLKILAQDLLFGGIKNHQQLYEKIEGQLQFRKGKTVDDVEIAVKKGLKMGRGKQDREVDCVAMYLESVFKQVKKEKGK